MNPRITSKALERDLKELSVKIFIGIQEVYNTFLKANENVEIKDYIFVSTLNSIDKKAIKAL